MNPENDGVAVEEFQDVILRFYEEAGRELPWRQTTDPYKILVSELMLQQTQVPRVITKYVEFVTRWPTPQSLAAAALSEVLLAWQGLGYNRRAKRLWEAARVLAENPEPSYDALLAIKGIGPYTAAAVVAFANNKDVAAIDVNIRRVFNRYFGAVDDSFVREALPAGRSRDWHNALMDFGSLVCTKKNPSCTSCPLRKDCIAYQHDNFGDEPSASQGRFLGTSRWHRGQVLRLVLERASTWEELWAGLDERYRDEALFGEALDALLDEGLLMRQGEAFHPRA